MAGAVAGAGAGARAGGQTVEVVVAQWGERGHIHPVQLPVLLRQEFCPKWHPSIDRS